MARTKNLGKGKRVENPNPKRSTHGKSSLRLFDRAFQHDKYLQRFDFHEVLHGRCLDIEFLESIKFPYINTFKTLGWWNFLTIHRVVLEDVIHAFYSNASNLFNARRFEERFKTNIGDTYFEVNTNSIHNTYGIPKGGEEYTAWTQNYVTACQVIFEDDTITTHIVDTTRLSFHNRLFHLIFCQMLVLRNGNFAQVTRLDL